MVRSYCSIGLTFITLFVLISLGIGGASALPINETVKNFRISFDAVDDTNSVAKIWSTGSNFLGNPLPPAILIPANGLTNGVMVVAGNATSKRWGGCIIIVLKNPENTSNTEKFMIGNKSDNYVRVFDRMIDGHKAILLNAGNYPSDPLMTYTAMYWLDEVNGKATELVLAISDWPEKEAERLLDTVHVERIGSGFIRKT